MKNRTKYYINPLSTDRVLVRKALLNEIRDRSNNEALRLELLDAIMSSEGDVMDDVLSDIEAKAYEVSEVEGDIVDMDHINSVLDDYKI